MIASHINHSTAFATDEITLFLKKGAKHRRSVKENSKNGHTSQKIVPIDEIVYIEGTVSVAF